MDERIHHGTEDEIKLALREIVAKIQHVKKWLNKNREMTLNNLVIYNFADSLESYINVLNAALGSHISLLALATRNIYEINVQLRNVLMGEVQLKEWMSECFTDKIQMIEGALSISAVSGSDVLEDEIKRLKHIRDEMNFPKTRSPAPIASIAEKVGLSEQHKSLYKLFSKLVHPSSMLVNDAQASNDDSIISILLVTSQVYAWDAFFRICEYFSVPEKLSKA